MSNQHQLPVNKKFNIYDQNGNRLNDKHLTESEVTQFVKDLKLQESTKDSVVTVKEVLNS